MKYIKAFLVAFFFIFFTNNVSALTHTSKFIDIDECYTNRSENLEVRNICFSKYQSTSSMYGTIFLGIENKTDDALDVEIIIAPENFKDESVIEDTYIAEQRNIIFDDETFTVSYKTETDTFLNGVLDIMPAFIITGGCISAVVLVISVIVYFSNKKKNA